MSNSIAPGSSADVNVRVTALTTNPNVPVTYKTIILKKNLVNGVNTLTQEMMSAQNTKYVIKYDYVLGEDISVPAGCILEFDGGSISASGSNDTITGNNTGIQAGLVKIFNTNVTFAGSWNIPESYPEWFGAKGDGVNDDTVSIQRAADSFNDILVFSAPKVCYKITNTINISNKIIIGKDLRTKEGICRIMATGNITAFIVSGGRCNISNIDLGFDNPGSDSVGFQLGTSTSQYSNGKIENVYVRYCAIGFKANSEGSVGTIWGTIFNKCTVYTNSYGFYLSALAGSTTISMNKCHVIGLVNTAKAFYLDNINTVYLQQIYCDTCKKALTVDHCACLNVNQLSCESNYFVDEPQVEIKRSNFKIDNLYFEAPQIVNEGKYIIQFGASAFGDLHITKNCFGVLDTSTINLIRVLTNTNRSLNIVGNFPANASRFTRNDFNGYDAYITFNGSHYIPSYAHLSDGVNAPKGTIYNLETPVISGNDHIIGYLKISDSINSGVLDTDFKAIKV